MFAGNFAPSPFHSFPSYVRFCHNVPFDPFIRLWRLIRHTLVGPCPSGCWIGVHQHIWDGNVGAGISGWCRKRKCHGNCVGRFGIGRVGWPTLWRVKETILRGIWFILFNLDYFMNGLARNCHSFCWPFLHYWMEVSTQKLLPIWMDICQFPISPSIYATSTKSGSWWARGHGHNGIGQRPIYCGGRRSANNFPLDILFHLFRFHHYWQFGYFLDKKWIYFDG